jgi:hypothetical protein
VPEFIIRFSDIEYNKIRNMLCYGKESVENAIKRIILSEIHNKELQKDLKLKKQDE